MTDDLVLDARRRSQPWPTLVFALLTVGIVLGLELAREHERVRAEQVSRLRTQVTVVTDNLARQLLGVKNALDGIRSDIAPPDKRPPPQVMAQRLQALSEAMPGVRGIMVLDAQGQVVSADRQDLSRRNFVDRPYFSAPRNEPLYSRLYVSAPFRSVLGRFSLNLTRAMTHPDGSFAGVVTANLDADYVEILARSVLYSPDMHLSILHGDGELFLDAHQEPPVLTSADFTAAAAALALVRAKPGEVVVTQMDDGANAERLLVVGAVQPSALDMDKPLLVAASRRLSDVYAPWRDQAVDYGLIFLLLSAGILSTVYFVEQRRNTAYLAGLERQRLAAVNARTLQFGLEGADLGFWEWNARTDTITVNAREADILGYGDGELELKPELWKELIPASEWDVVFAAFKNHVKASTAAFSGEHRIRRKDGRMVWVQSHAVVSERDGRNRPLQILGTHLDISEKKAAEQAIHDTAQRLELAMETGRMGLVDLDVATGALIVNARGFEIVGWTTAESAQIELARWRALLHPDDVARVDATFEPTLAGLTQSRSCEYRLRHSDGHDVWVQMRARAVALDPDGKAARVVGAFQDITEARQASTQLAEAAELQRRTGSLARVGGWQFDVANAQMTWTDELYEIHELPMQPVTLESSMAFYLPPARAALRQAVQEALAHGTAWCLDAQISTALGNPLWVRTQGEAVVQAGQVVQLVGASQDITERIAYSDALKEANAQLERLTLTDGLTGVGNRRLLDQTLQAEWQRCGRGSQPLGVMMVDIDHFKAYNDTYGHQQGDAALVRVAELLQRCVQRSGEMVARYGGEEFVVILPGSDWGDVSRVANVFAALLQQANMPHAASPVARVLTVSIGIAACIPTPADGPESLLASADAALYGAKSDGRNRIAHTSRTIVMSR